jgi:hypothetical protein
MTGSALALCVRVVEDSSPSRCGPKDGSRDASPYQAVIHAQMAKRFNALELRAK